MIDNDIGKIVKEGIDLVFGEYPINSVDDIVSFEQRYNNLSLKLLYPWNDEWFDFKECNLSILTKNPFSLAFKFYNPNNEGIKRFLDLDLSELEIIVLKSFLAQASGIYRLDSYYYGIPPIVTHLNDALQSALKKLPSFNGNVLVRQYHEYDSDDFSVDDVFEPCYSLTTSANPEWNDGSWNQYIIRTLSYDKTKAKSLTFVNDFEQQVTFLIGARFKIVRVEVCDVARKRIYMDEIE